MADLIFFTEYFIGSGTTVDLDSPEPSRWTILEKVSEENYQITEEDVEDFGYTASYACAKYRCLGTGGRAAFMRVYMQVPVRGSEFHPAHQRARQAVTHRDIQELNVLRHFLEKQSTITPRLLAWKEGTQADDGLIPGGYLTFLVWEQVPGLSLAQDRVPAAENSKLNHFWKLAPADRSKIRQKFREEYPKLAELGFAPTVPWASNLVYDKDSDKLYFVGFKNCVEVDLSKKADNMVLAVWGLAVAPENPQKADDVSQWKW